MINVVMPQMGESLAEGTVVRWLKGPGDSITRDEPLLEISTDKVDAEVPSPVDGVLREILVTEGQTVAVGVPVALVEPAEAGATAAEPAARVQSSTPGPAAVPAVAGTAPATGATVAASGAAPSALEEPHGHFKVDHAPQLVSFGRDRGSAGAETPAPGVRPYSPAVLEAARQGGVSLGALTTMPGSGRGGRVTKRDVEQFVASGAQATPAAPGPGRPVASESSHVPPEYLYRPLPDDRVVPMSIVRRKIADHMSWSVRISPHASAFAECDMSRAAALIERGREDFAAAYQAPLTYTVLAAQAVLAALREFPGLNASVLADNLVLKPRVNLGIAVALTDADELIVPVIQRADELSLGGLARAIHDLATRARERRLRPGDVQGGSFTLTNPGIFAGVTGTPILNQPQVGIVGLGAITKRPVVINDAIAIRPVMTISLTFDHRAADGVQAFRFLDRMRRQLEDLPADLDGAVSRS